MDTNNKRAHFKLRDFVIGICTGALLVIVVFFTCHSIIKSSVHPACDLTCKSTCNESKSARPHSPYLLQRDTMDGGFSKDWMPHFLPSEEYWVDMHAHMKGVTDSDMLKRLIDSWFAMLDGYRLGQIVAISEQNECFKVFGETVAKDPRFAWMYWPNIDKPSLSSVREAVQNGSCAIKLHNVRIITGDTPRDIWQHNEWQQSLSFAETAGIPILWHVTQRHSYSPYHGGGLHAYWKDGWAKGINFTNEDLLQDVLAIMRKYPKLKVIGAHQLHVGPKRLNELLEKYENLYIDSSCGMYLRWADDLIEEDRLVMRDFVEKWSERILFGTDADIRPGNFDEYAVQGYLCHSRFMLKLGLTDKALQDVSWRTTSRLLKMPPVSAARRGGVRP
jgi:predicted TIM-barrel fold metal-dependent hydrolase